LGRRCTALLAVAVTARLVAVSAVLRAETVRVVMVVRVRVTTVLMVATRVMVAARARARAVGRGAPA